MTYDACSAYVLYPIFTTDVFSWTVRKIPPRSPAPQRLSQWSLVMMPIVNYDRSPRCMTFFKKILYYQTFPLDFWLPPKKMPPVSACIPLFINLTWFNDGHDDQRSDLWGWGFCFTGEALFVEGHGQCHQLESQWGARRCVGWYLRWNSWATCI